VASSSPNGAKTAPKSAGGSYDHRVAHYGKQAIFNDVDNIPCGEHFPAYIQTKLGACAITLAVFGPALARQP
jgi:hypothetical protein